jgi:hypothetical protein
VDVVLADDISEQLQSVLILKKLPGVEHDLNGLGQGEHGQPANDRSGQEVGESGFAELI